MGVERRLDADILIAPNGDGIRHERHSRHPQRAAQKRRRAVPGCMSAGAPFGE
jgi:hypothetical protein